MFEYIADDAIVTRVPVTYIATTDPSGVTVSQSLNRLVYVAGDDIHADAWECVTEWELDGQAPMRVVRQAPEPSELRSHLSYMYRHYSLTMVGKLTYDARGRMIDRTYA